MFGEKNGTMVEGEESLTFGRFLSSPDPGEEVVISGIAGYFPKADNMYELRDNFMNHVDMIADTHRHWNQDDPRLIYKSGMVKDLSKFDSSFFHVHYQEADSMCSQLRCLFERTYEAIVDAGVNPCSLKGTRTGVYVACSSSESETEAIYEKSMDHAFSVRSYGRNMFPARISYWLGVSGPSMAIDCACSSAMFALNEAYEHLRTGVIDYAVVGASNVCLQLCSTIQFDNLGVLNPDGKVKAFDEEANGYTRSEAIPVLFLQRAKDAKRMYATIVHSKTNNDGAKSEGITYPGAETQEMLFRDFYQECGIDPVSIDYMEAHATGTKAGDVVEMNAVDRVFCRGRQIPLLVGSSKSNLGHAESSSGFCSIAKVILAMEYDIIPANLHFNIPRKLITGIIDGRIQVTAEHTPLPGDLVAINGFGFGGSNAHLLLRRHTKTKVNGRAPNDSLPRLVAVSGRTMEAVTSILDEVKSRPVDTEFIGLLHDFFAVNTQGHLYRGYTLVGGNTTMGDVQECTVTGRPVWFVFSGYGDHWLYMARSLLRIPQFASLVKACDEALSPKNLSLETIINRRNINNLDELNKFLVTTAVQVGLVDILSRVGITANGFLSHKAGEIVCAYADGCLSAKQAILLAYYFGLAMNNNAGINLIERLQQVILDPKERSKRWKTASFLEDEHRNPAMKFASPEYFNKCLQNSTLYKEAFQNIKKNSFVIDFTSPGLVKTLLNKTKDKTIAILSFLAPGSNGLERLFTLLGRLYVAGLQPQLAKLYPPVQYPVSRSTPMISPLIRWDHSRTWNISGTSQESKSQSEAVTTIKFTQSTDKFYKGHIIDGRNLFPATGYLYLVWDAFSQMNGANYMLSVVFRNMRFNRATTLTEDGKVDFVVSIQRHSGVFEVVEGGSAIVTGRIETLENSKEQMLVDLKLPSPAEGRDLLDLNTKDIAKELRLRGYNYRDLFRGLIRVDNSASTGLIKWNDNWVAFMDTMLQLRILSKDSRSLYVPTGLNTIIVDVTKHMNELNNCATQDELPIYSWDQLDIIRAGGVEIRGLGANSIARRKPLGEPVLERYQFVPHSPSCDDALSLEQAVRMCVHVMLENHLGPKVVVYELAKVEDDLDADFLGQHILNTLQDLPLLQGEVFILTGGNDKDVADIKGLQFVVGKKFPGDHNALLTVGTNVINNPTLLDNMMGALANDGCILAREICFVDIKDLNPELQIVANIVVQKERLILMRKTPLDLGSPILINITEKNFSWLPQLQAALKDTKPPQRVVLVSQGEPLSGILGLFNCVRREPGGELARCFFILDAEAPEFDPALPLYGDQLKKDLAVNVLQDGQWGSYRHLLLEPPPYITAPHGYNNVRVRGDLSSLTWFEGPISDLSHPEDIIHIYYSALNFRDIMLSTGKLAPEAVIKDRTKMDILQGLEFSGRDSNGKRVMGLSDVGCFANLMKKKNCVYWEVPESWSLEEAATVPVVYATAIYALKVEGRLQPGESVLIHAGSGGVGQAAINYCLFYGCTVFTTVGTQEKREFIKKQFPQITDDYIGNSRDLTFEEFIIRRTNGRGVDMILNSLAEEKLQASIRCLAKGGRFLEIGKFDMSINNSIVMERFTNGRSFHGVMLDLFFGASPEVQEFLRFTLQTAIDEGSVKPLVRAVFDTEQVEEAFRHMAAGRHIGKVLVEICREEDDNTAMPRIRAMEVRPRFHCDPRLSYIVLGGLGGFGLELSDWLVLRGAKSLVLTSRRGITTGYQSLRIRIWRSYGVRVEVATNDVSTVEGATQLLNEANNIAPVGGIFNLAVVLRDAFLENQTEESFQESFKGKAMATRHLDVLSRHLCPQLRHFVVFSSVSCGRGNAGQTNYGMSNSVMERICEARVRDGLPGVAIQWGAVGDVGLVADMQEEHQELVIGGTLQQRISSCLEVMDNFLKQPHPVVASMVVAEKRSATGKFDNIVDCVANILGLRDVKTVSAMSPLTELGMDSIMAVEIKQAIELEFEVFLTPQEIRTLTFKKLEELAAAQQKSGTADTGAEPASGEESPNPIEFMIGLVRTEHLAPRIVLPLSSSGTSQNPVFMVPGMEGVPTSLMSLSSKLNASCIALQLCFRNPSSTIAGMAAHLLQNIREMLVPGTSFTLLGHSFGGLVVLEMAKILEEEGNLGRIVLLDSSPESTPKLLEDIILKGAMEDAEIQIGLIKNLLNFSFPGQDSEIDKMCSELELIPSWEGRVDKAATFYPDEDRYYHQTLFRSIWTSVVAMRGYHWTEGAVIRSPVTLIRPFHSRVVSTEDYGLSKICQQPVSVHFVEGNHTSILQNPASAEIINKILEE